MKTLLPALRHWHRRVRGLIIGAALVLLPLVIIHVGHSQGGSQTPKPPFKGESGRVLLVPNQTVDAGEIKFKADTDSDGMSDEDENNNGTDPDDPTDADTDNDGDGLSNGDEVAMRTNLNTGDTDGDGVSDGEEARLGYNPTDPLNRPPANAALASLQISPNPINISINTLFGQPPLQLRITGVRTDNTTFDLTGSATLTYQSLNENVLLIDDAGNVAGVGAGTTIVRITSGNVSADAPVEVASFTPAPVAALNIPGYANNVEVVGDYAYVAAGAAGLQIVNVGNRQTPAIIAALNTPGNANDVAVVAGKAYVADGQEGLRVIDVSNPAAPVALGFVDTPGNAEDVAVVGPRAYVADGAAGLQIIDVSDPSAPTIIGTADTPSYARGVGVAGQLVVVADGVTDTSDDDDGDIFATIAPGDAGNALRIVDATNPANPQLVGAADLGFGEAMDVTVRDRIAYVASLYAGVMVVDFSTPTLPRIVGNTSIGVPRDVALFGRYVMEADVQFINAVPIFDIADPRVLNYRGALDLSATGDYNGTGIALDGQYIYLTGSFDIGPRSGTTGPSSLMIGRYQAQTDPTDTAGVAPTISIDEPQNGQTVIEGHELILSANALDDVGVAAVTFSVNGTPYATDVVPPFSFTTNVPLGATSLTIGATAVDHAGNTGTATPVVVNVSPNPAPTISIIAPAEGTQLSEGQAVEISAVATDDAPITQVVFNINGQTIYPVTSDPYTSALHSARRD